MGPFLFDAVNLILAAAMYTLIGRYLLSLLFADSSEAVIWRVFRQVTDPILALVRVITPRIVHERLVVLLAVVWVLLGRVLLALGALSATASAGG
jgi:uncharacterized protein YggT (Ycf19 family)